MLVCTHEVSAEALQPGSIVVSGGRARYLEEKTATVGGYAEWSYTAYEVNGTAVGGTMNVRAGAKVMVVAQLLDGAVVTP